MLMLSHLGLLLTSWGLLHPGYPTPRERKQFTLELFQIQSSQPRAHALIKHLFYGALRLYATFPCPYHIQTRFRQQRSALCPTADNPELFLHPMGTIVKALSMVLFPSVS